MKHRKLQIAWSVAWGLVAVLLVAMWVRSYSKFDSVGWHSQQSMYYSLFSLHGHITFVKGFNSSGGVLGMYFEIGLQALETFVDSSGEPKLTHFLGLKWYSSHGAQAFREFIFAMPYWFALLLVTAVCIAPWTCYRFSLRTLLIVTTLVAAGLGLAVFMARK